MWAQAKSTAASMGMSFNEYIQYLVDDSTRKTFFGYKEKPLKTKRKPKKSFYQAMWELANKKYVPKPMGANEDDKIIYGIEDDK